MKAITGRGNRLPAILRRRSADWSDARTHYLQESICCQVALCWLPRLFKIGLTILDAASTGTLSTFATLRVNHVVSPSFLRINSANPSAKGLAILIVWHNQFIISPTIHCRRLIGTPISILSLSRPFACLGSRRRRSILSAVRSIHRAFV